MKNPNRIFDRYKRSTGDNRASQLPPTTAPSYAAPSTGLPVPVETMKPSAARERSTQQHHPHSLQQPSGQYFYPSQNTNHPPRLIVPPSCDADTNPSVQRIKIPPLSSADVQDITKPHASSYRHSTESYIDQTDDPLHRWRENEANASSQYRNAINIQRGSDTNTSSSGRQSYDYSTRSNSRDYNYTDSEDHPFTTSTTQQPNTSRNSHPVSVIVSPNYDEDFDNEERLRSSISSRLSFEPWESAVQPPPFLHENQMSDNHYSNYSSAPSTTRRYNYSDIHEPMYDDRNNGYEPYSYRNERGIPAASYNDIPSHHQHFSVESDYAPRTSWNNSTGSTLHETAPTRRIGATNMSEPKMIEITPGNMSRLRDAQETISAIQNDFYVPCTCLFCNITSSSSPYSDSSRNPREPIFCIQDAEYFLCPHCASINRLDVDDTSPYSSTRNGAFHTLGGVGLGFTVKTLLEVQKEYLTNHRT